MNLAELLGAYKSGTVTAPMMLDNDEVCVYQNERLVFTAHPDALLTEALNLLGIPHEHV